MATTIERGPSIVAGSKIEISFLEGRIVVNGGCNTMFGAVSLEDDAVAVEQLASTKMACDSGLMDQDNWINDFLCTEPKWKLEGDVLTLDNGMEKIVLDAV